MRPHKANMKRIFSILTVLALTSFCSANAADKPAKVPLAALEAADDARIAATKAGNEEKLRAIFSDDLHYAHSTGDVDSKTSLISKVTSGKTKYVVMEYEKREFTLPAPEIALMTGRIHMRAVSGENTTDTLFSFLGAWRLENGEWHFLAWQSCKLPTK